MKIHIIGHSFVRDLTRLNRSFELQNTSLKPEFTGIPGATFNTFLNNDRHFENLERQQPDWIIVYLGSNDIRTDVHIPELKDQCKRFHLHLRQIAPHAKILTALLENRYLFQENRHGSPEASEYIRIVKFINKWLQKQSFTDGRIITRGTRGLNNISLYRADRTHLNSEGLNLLWEIIEGALKHHIQKD